MALATMARAVKLLAARSRGRPMGASPPLGSRSSSLHAASFHRTATQERQRSNAQVPAATRLAAVCQ